VPSGARQSLTSTPGCTACPVRELGQALTQLLAAGATFDFEVSLFCFPNGTLRPLGFINHDQLIRKALSLDQFASFNQKTLNLLSVNI
jgi:hypothetical protein